MHFFNRFFRPIFLEKMASSCARYGLFFSVLFFTLGTYSAFFASPLDYQQGESVRFMYIHVPASWFALMLYTVMATLSAIGYMAKIPTAHLLTRALALPGTLMALISVMTGSLWGKVTWGTYWVWDARLTSMFILLMMYIGYIILSHKKRVEQLHTLSLFVIVGVINIPIIKYSVDMWFTLHQPASIMRMAKPAIDPAFLPPLFLFAAGYFFYVTAISARLFLTSLHHEKKKSERLRSSLKQAVSEHSLTPWDEAA